MKKKTLPATFYTKKQYLISFVSLFMVAAITIGIFLLTIKVWHMQIWQPILIALPICFIFYLAVWILSNPFPRMVKSVNTTGDYAKFSKELNELYNENLHPETRTYLKIIEAAFLTAVDKNAAIELYEGIEAPKTKQYRMLYDGLCMDMALIRDDYNALNKLIEEFKLTYPKSKNHEKINREALIYTSTDVIEDIESFYPTTTKYIFLNMINSEILMKYYLKRNQYNNAKRYANFILDANTELATLNQAARDCIDTIDGSTK